MSKIILKIVVCLLLVLWCLPGYSQRAESRPEVSDTISRLNQEFRRQELLENYVKLLSDNDRNEKEGESCVLVLPVMGIRPSQLSYGLMIGLVKRTGGYVKFRHSFSKASDDGEECNDEGVESGTGQMRWYSGRTEKSRLAVTAGVLQQLWKPVYLYAGIGYGKRTLSWETTGGEWVKNADHSFQGMEAEIGGIVRYGSLAFSLGIQTNSFKYIEANVGIGVIF